MRYLPITFFLLYLSTWELSGQVNEITNPRPEAGDLSLELKSISFVKNNEYFNPVTEGYTMLGSFFQPQLVYTPSEKIALRAGIHLLKYYGTSKFSQARPVFSASLNLTENTALRIGTLDGSEKHLLYDPHFNSERLYNANAEDGFQLKTDNGRFFNDTWISWENFIFKGDSTREIFTFGESFRYRSSPIAENIFIEVPVQVQFRHFGGQISNYPQHVETFFNIAAGLRINIDLAGRRYGQAGIEYLQFINNELNGESQSGITKGHASWLRFYYTFKAITFGAAYWKSHDFYAPNGNTIYSSVSDYQEGVVIHDRKIISNNLSLRLLPENYFELFLGLDTYYDIDLKRLDNSITLHLNFDKLIRLATLEH
jgi:hypothetical protein